MESKPSSTGGVGEYAVCVTTTWPWPVRDGVTSKTGNLFPHFGLRLKLVSGGPATQTPIDVIPLLTGITSERSNSWFSYIRAGLSGTLAVPSYLTAGRVLPLVRDSLEAVPPAFVHLDTMSAAHLIRPVRDLLAEFGYDCPIVLSINDSYSLLLRDTSPVKSKFRRELKLAHVRRVERRLLPQASFVDVVSDLDRIWLERLTPSAHVRVIPLGRPPKPSHAVVEKKHDLLLFSARAGLCSYLQELVALGRPAIRVSMVGTRPEPKVLRLLQELGGQYLGFVEDLGGVISSARLVVAPSQQSAGSSNKAIQAMSLGVPVAGGQCLYGLPGVVAGEHCFIAADARTLAATTFAVLSDAAHLAKVGAAGRDLIERRPDWPSVAALYRVGLHD